MSHPEAGVLLESDTGIDVAPAIAGPGARALAFVIDWHIRLLVALAWLVIAAVLMNGRLALTVPHGHVRSYFYLVTLPALSIYFLYHAVLETVLHGHTPGKRRAGIRIVARHGGPPGIGALLLRNVFRLVDSLPVGYGVGLLFMLLTRDSVRCGDIAAGTLVIYERAAVDPEFLRDAAQRTATLDAAGAEIAADLLQRWDSLVPEARMRLARALLQRYRGDVSDGDELSWRARIERLASR
jgi:uncharacterized RDD family membrane protein YckC